MNNTKVLVLPKESSVCQNAAGATIPESTKSKCSWRYTTGINKIGMQ
jgi:hypothetical protein